MEPDAVAAGAWSRTAAFALDSITEMISVIGADRIYRAVNEHWCRVTGLPRERVVGRHVASVLNRHVPPALQYALSQCLDHQEPQRIREWVTLPNQPPRCFEINYYPYRDDAQPVPLAVVVTRDVTAEERSKAAAVDAQLAAEVADRSKSRFLSRMSHELRTPLNGVLGFAQLMQMDEAEPLSPAQRRRLDEIAGNARALLVLIEQLCDLSQLGSLALRLQPVGVSRLIDDCIDSVRPQAARRELQVLASFVDAAPVRADPARLRQVLLNLLRNAVAHSRPGGRVEVGCERRAARLTIYVRDTGPGLDAGQRQRLFRPFERLDDRVDGAGIGLALSRELVELMDGRIGIDSAPGRGSVFWVELPLA